ncbi:hypothetical protein FRC11_012225 [Ceratobasidium sp. 423]|nr:hypothetical protein FRC11_012225 [Ceratobasidium sp. 423]
MSNPTTGNITDPTLLDSNMDVARSPMVAEDDPADDSKIDKIQSTQEGLHYEVDSALAEIYPALASPLADWHDMLCAVSQLANHNYLIAGSDSKQTRELCSKIPELLNTVIQAMSHATGAYIDMKAIWYDYSHQSSLRSYSTITENVQEFIGEAEAQDNIASYTQFLCNVQDWQGAHQHPWDEIGAMMKQDDPAIDLA